MSEFKNNDIVICKEIFGNMPLIFVGFAESLDWANDCVVINNGQAVPIQSTKLVKVSE